MDKPLIELAADWAVAHPKHTATICAATYTVALIRSEWLRDFTWRYITRPILGFIGHTIDDAVGLTANTICNAVVGTLTAIRRRRWTRIVTVGGVRMHIVLARLQPLRPDLWNERAQRQTKIASNSRVLHAMRELAEIVDWQATPIRFEKLPNGRTYVYDAPFEPNLDALRMTLQRAGLEVTPFNLGCYRDKYDKNYEYIIRIDDTDFRRRLSAQTNPIFDQDLDIDLDAAVGEKPNNPAPTPPKFGNQQHLYTLVARPGNQQPQPATAQLTPVAAQWWEREPDLTGIDGIAHYLDHIPKVGDTPDRFGVTPKEVKAATGLTRQAVAKALAKHLERGNIIEQDGEYARPF